MSIKIQIKVSILQDESILNLIYYVISNVSTLLVISS